MNSKKRFSKFQKHSLLIMALILALGLLVSTAVTPSYASTTQYVSAPTLTTPTITASASKGYDSAKIVWSAVAGATFYEVSYATSASGPYSLAGTTTGTSFTKTGLTSGKTYYLKVRAGVEWESTNIYSSYSTYKAITPIPTTPVATAASASYTSIKVSWATVPGATGYKVYRATSSTGSYTYLGATSSLAYTSASLTTGKTYYYKVIAYRTIGTAKVYSKASAPVHAVPIPSKPTVSVSTYTATKAKISWSGVSGTTKYLIYRATSESGDYSLVYTASSTARSYINTGLTTGKTYYYKVRSYRLVGTTKVYGSVSLVKSVKLGSVYGTGDYKVGTDIPAGEYMLIATDLDAAMFYTSTDLAGDNLKTYGFPWPNIYETLRAGEYVHFTGLKAYPVATAPAVPVNSDGSFLPAQYKVGRDIPAGDYVLVYQSTEEYGDFYIESNSYNELSSICGYDSYRGRIYVTLTAGQYFTFDAGIAYPVAIAPALDKSQPELYDGMYLVGTDIPAGTYTIYPPEEDNLISGYYVVYSDQTHSDDSVLGYDDLISGSSTVTVTDGQYLYVFNGRFMQL